MSGSGTILRYDGRVALVTGAGHGLGRAHALLLASRGAKVVVNDIEHEAAASVADEIAASGGMAIFDASDMAQEAAPGRIVELALDTWGSVDIILSNAGASQHQDVGGLTAAQFEQTLRLHVFAAFFLAQAAWPHMAVQRRGRILFTTSFAGFFGQARNHDYSAAKAALFGLTRSLSIDGRPHGIHVNCLAPRAGTRAAEGMEDPEFRRIIRAMKPEMVSPLACWLVHDDCQVSGEAVDSGGGLMRRIFAGLTKGHRAALPTIEDAQEHFPQIIDDKGYSVPGNCLDNALDT